MIYRHFKRLDRTIFKQHEIALVGPYSLYEQNICHEITYIDVEFALKTITTC